MEFDIPAFPAEGPTPCEQSSSSSLRLGRACTSLPRGYYTWCEGGQVQIRYAAKSRLRWLLGEIWWVGEFFRVAQKERYTSFMLEVQVNSGPRRGGVLVMRRQGDSVHIKPSVVQKSGDGPIDCGGNLVIDLQYYILQLWKWTSHFPEYRYVDEVCCLSFSLCLAGPRPRPQLEYPSQHKRSPVDCKILYVPS